MSNKVFERGSVWLVDLGNHTNGSVQGGLRPCVIISNNKGNHFSNILTVLPLSSATSKLRKTLPTHTLLKKDMSNVIKDSVIMAEQITIISQDQAIEKLFELDYDILNRVNYTLAIQLGMLQNASA